MAAIDGPTREFLSQTVLDDRADRVDRLFALRMLLEEEDRSNFVVRLQKTTPVNSQLARISKECRDPFLRRLAALSIRRHLIAEEIAGLEPSPR